MTRCTLAGARYTWCDRAGRHTHTEQLNGPHLVNGRPAGPWAELHDPAATAARAERSARFRALVDTLLDGVAR